MTAEEDEEVNTRCPCGCDSYHWEDHGIGHYEYWGAQGIHHDYQAVCDECGEDVVPDMSFGEWKRQQEIDNFVEPDDHGYW